MLVVVGEQRRRWRQCIFWIVIRQCLYISKWSIFGVFYCVPCKVWLLFTCTENKISNPTCKFLFSTISFKLKVSTERFTVFWLSRHLQEAWQRVVPSISLVKYTSVHLLLAPDLVITKLSLKEA